MTQQTLEVVGDWADDEAAIVTELDISHLVIEDDTPVDNFQSAQQQRFLINALYSSKALPLPFIAEADVGLFYKLKGDPIVPDMLLSLGVQRAEDLSERRNRSYFVWEFGKVPDVCIEIISNQEGDELNLSPKSRQKGKTASKREIYAQVGVPYYVVFDPLQQLQGETEMNGALLRVWQLEAGKYVEITPTEGIRAVGRSVWLEQVGLGLVLWEGQFEEEVIRLWLRWCNREGQLLLTGDERAEQESLRAEQERQARLDAVSRLSALNLTAEQIAEALSLSIEQVRSLLANC